MILGNNWLNIERLWDGKYRVVTRAGTELAAKLSREDANAACCALCIHEVSPGYRDESLVWLSIMEGKYRVTRPAYVPSWDEIKIGTIADIRRWHKLLNRESRFKSSS